MQPTEWSNTYTHMQPVTEQPQQVVCMWVAWALNIHPGWHPLQAKTDYRSWLSTSCGSGPLPRTGSNKRKRKVVHSSHVLHSVLILVCLSDPKYSVFILCRCRFNVAVCMLHSNIVQNWVSKLQCFISRLFFRIKIGGLNTDSKREKLL